jgi:hypothetical protein
MIIQVRQMQNRKEFPDLLNKLSYSSGIELGVFKGEFSKVILNNWSGTLYLIDVWRPLPVEEYDDVSNNQYHSNAYSDVIKNIKEYEDRAFMLRMGSKDAIKIFEDQSLDFIYIDANHTYESVKEDIELWYPKIKIGGMISGHDYVPQYLFDQQSEKNIPILLGDNQGYVGMFGVNPAVNEFVDGYNHKLNVTDEFLGTWWVIKQ